MLSEIPVSRANDILSASYQLYQHIGTNRTVLRTLSYGLPSVLLPHVQTVAPTTHFGLPLSLRKKPLVRPSEEAGAPENAAMGERGTAPLSRGIVDITPSLLRWQYQTLGYVPAAMHRNVLGIFGLLNDYPSPDDLSLFMSRYRTDGDFGTFTVVKVNDGRYDPKNPGTEGSQNIQYTAAMTYPTTLEFYSTGGNSHPAYTLEHDAFINWLYYMLSRTNVPQTITFTSGFEETAIPPDYTMFVCELFAELGLRGASVLAASGDDGVGAGECLVNDGSGNKYVRFRPTFPSTCTCNTFFLCLKAVHKH